jgi:hypothetical protein
MISEKRKILTCYVTSVEHEFIKKAAGKAKISVSKYVRLVCLGVEPKSKIAQEAVLAFLQVNQDLSRLGNLFKLAVDQGRLDEKEVRKLISSITEMKKELLEKAREI